MSERANREMLDVAAYEQRVRGGRCFICQIIDGSHEFSHGVISRDEQMIAFLDRYPTLRGAALVAPIEHQRSLVDDFGIDEYLALQRLVYRVGQALSVVLPTERLYVLSLGSNQGNDHVHWHVVPLPPGTPYSKQQHEALMVERSGYIAMSEFDHAALAAEIRTAMSETQD